MSLRSFAAPRVATALRLAQCTTMTTPRAPMGPRVTLQKPAPTESVRVLSGNSSFSSGLFGKTQVRLAHIDHPNFDNYKRDQEQGAEVDYQRRAFTYLLGAGSAVATLQIAKSLVVDFLDTMSASADVLALAKMEVDLSSIPEGKNVTFKWRGKPVFVRHRPQAEIDVERAVDVSSLRHQESDEDRVQKPEWLVVLGICTHLGCVPIANAGEFGGYFCPCHGSHYDASGRIRKGPAPLNLEVPEHSFDDEENKLVIG